jgi:hypothetical protein
MRLRRSVRLAAPFASIADALHYPALMAAAAAPLVQLPPSPAGEARLRDNGHGPLIKRWDHSITVTDNRDGITRCADNLDIGAGLLTPFVWLSAPLLFIHRQWRLQALAKAGLEKLSQAA